MIWRAYLELIGVLAWPMVVGLALLLYHRPLSRFIAGLGQRATKLSAFEVSIELAALPSPPAPWSDPVFPESSKLLGGDVQSTALSGLLGPLEAEKPWDYLIVDVKNGGFWLVSRLFIFTVFLNATRGLKCVVFVQTSGENRRRLLGLASPDALRSALA